MKLIYRGKNHSNLIDITAAYVSSNYLFNAMVFICVVLYISITMHMPVSIYTSAIHDDALFISNSVHILRGEWLGVFNNTTLVKGVGYPLFLVVNALLGTPITLMQSLFYLLACYMLLRVLYKIGVNKYILLFMLAFLLFHPQLFPIRIIRDNIYPALTLIVVAGVISIVFLSTFTAKDYLRNVLYGLALGWFWITREEGIWILPGIVLFLLLNFLINAEKVKKIDQLKCLVVYFGGALVVILSISSINYLKYGSFQTVDFKSDSYTNALKALYSVNVGDDIRYVPVSYKRRNEIYGVSPTFSKLRPYFDGEGKAWTIPGCQVYPTTCGDYAGGWFTFALRDAVSSLGYYKNPQMASDFYNSITMEIDHACDEGLIKCRNNPIPYMPNIGIEQLKDIPDGMINAFKLLLMLLPVDMSGGDSWGTKDKLDKYRIYLGNPRSMPSEDEKIYKISGWFYSNNSNWIELTCNSGDLKAITPIKKLPSPDLIGLFKDIDASERRFSIDIKNVEKCRLKVIDTENGFIEIESIIKGSEKAFDLGANNTIFVDDVNYQNYSYEKEFELKRKIGILYSIITPVFLSLGFVIYLINMILIFIKKTHLTKIFLIATMLWVLIFTRIIILVLIDISSFPAINPLYMSPLFALACVVAMLSVNMIKFDHVK